jgi:hypothetical protein
MRLALALRLTNERQDVFVVYGCAYCTPRRQNQHRLAVPRKYRQSVFEGVVVWAMNATSH